MTDGRTTTDAVAARWVARESFGALSAEDRDGLAAWLAADVANKTAYEAASEALRKAEGARFALRRVDREQRAQESKRSRASLQIGVLAASVAAIAVLLFRADLVGMTSDYSASSGLPQEIALSDGTTVVLDTRSAIDVNYSSEGREVTLVQGRAFFIVVHDSSRPFRVRALGGEALDVGTAFIVERRDGRAEVRVTEGEVQISNGSAQLNLTEGFGASWSEGQAQLNATAFDVDDALGWRDGRIFVDRKSLETVVAELNRYRRRPILLLDSDAARRSVSGVVQLAEIERGLAALAQAQGLKAMELPFATVIYSPDP